MRAGLLIGSLFVLVACSPQSRSVAADEGNRPGPSSVPTPIPVSCELDSFSAQEASLPLLLAKVAEKDLSDACLEALLLTCDEVSCEAKF